MTCDRGHEPVFWVGEHIRCFACGRMGTHSAVHRRPQHSHRYDPEDSLHAGIPERLRL